MSECNRFKNNQKVKGLGFIKFQEEESNVVTVEE
jgi:hypothetical protein